MAIMADERSEAVHQNAPSTSQTIVVRSSSLLLETQGHDAGWLFVLFSSNCHSSGSKRMAT